MSAEDVVRELFALWNDGRIDELDRCLAPVVDHERRPETVEQLADWHRRDRGVWAGTTYQIHDLVSDGSKVAVRWSANASTSAPGDRSQRPGSPFTGKAFTSSPLPADA